MIHYCDWVDVTQDFEHQVDDRTESIVVRIISFVAAPFSFSVTLLFSNAFGTPPNAK